MRDKLVGAHGEDAQGLIMYTTDGDRLTLSSELTPPNGRTLHSWLLWVRVGRADSQAALEPVAGFWFVCGRLSTCRRWTRR
ncbi:hypothetical protein AWC15_21280 [Mycobacterium lacus]|uniref:Uncharacterized protein n=1 Tax=Mycobacterium lacus TaxID=169765 RepID=A0A1X1Y6Z0_9MYCO|nr:hypothetical protein AWC15_21280 [Mycobacterium lacus]BBX96322.1 hypothetical protein MLAC_16160 [Mycobacterium lacus]